MNIDVGISTGTIFGIYEQKVECCIDDVDETLSDDSKKRLVQQLTHQNLVAAGYCMYSATTIMVISIGTGMIELIFALNISLQVLYSFLLALHHFLVCILIFKNRTLLFHPCRCIYFSIRLSPLLCLIPWPILRRACIHAGPHNRRICTDSTEHTHS